MDIPRARVGKPELHGFAVQGASRLREDPASVARLHRKPELRDEGRRDLRARQLCQPGRRTTSLRRPCSTSSREERTARSASRRYQATSSSAGPPPATASRPSTIGGQAAGINAQNDTYDFSGGASTLASRAPAGATTITTRSPISGYISWLTFADGKTYQISKASGTTITLASGLTAAESGRSGGVRQPVAPDRLRIGSGPAGRDIGAARRGYHPAYPLCQRGDRGKLLHDRGRFRPAERLLPHSEGRAGSPGHRWNPGLLRRSRRRRQRRVPRHLS